MNYSPFRHFRSIFLKTKPIHLTFFLTRRCNARCRFCFYLSHTKNSSKQEAELSLDEIQKISSSLGNLLWLAFSGGEIFLRHDLVEIAQVFYQQNRPAIMLFPTNGLLTQQIRLQTESILKKCPKSTIVVKLSLDGLEAVNDSIRMVEGAFAKTLETYKALKDLADIYPNLELGVNSVFCSENQDQLDNLIDFVSNLQGIRTHTVSLIRGTVSDPDLKKIDPQKYLNIVSRMERDFKAKNQGVYSFWGGKIKAAQDILQRRFIFQTLIEKKRIIPCFAGRLNIVITESGDLFPCESFAWKMGNLRDNGYDLQRLMNRGSAKEVIGRIKDKQCFCTHECYFLTNILFNPILYPKLLKAYCHL